MTKIIELKKLQKQLNRAEHFREAAICLESAMLDVLNAYPIADECPFDFDSPQQGPRKSKMAMKQIRAALNDFERRTNTAVLEFEWPSTVHDLQLKRKEAEKDGRVDDIHKGPMDGA